MSTATAATTELYRQMALRFARTLTAELGDDPLNLLDTRPVTEEEAQAEAAEMVANFSRILKAREGLSDPYLRLGCDLILDLPQRA